MCLESGQYPLSSGENDTHCDEKVTCDCGELQFYGLSV